MLMPRDSDPIGSGGPGFLHYFKKSSKDSNSPLGRGLITPARSFPSFQACTEWSWALGPVFTPNPAPQGLPGGEGSEEEAENHNQPEKFPSEGLQHAREVGGERLEQGGFREQSGEGPWRRDFKMSKSQLRVKEKRNLPTVASPLLFTAKGHENTPPTRDAAVSPGPLGPAGRGKDQPTNPEEPQPQHDCPGRTQSGETRGVQFPLQL